MSNLDSSGRRRPGHDGGPMTGAMNGKDTVWAPDDEAALQAWAREQGLAERRAMSTGHLMPDLPVVLPSDELARERERRSEAKRVRAAALSDWHSRTAFYLGRAGVPEEFRAKDWSDFKPIAGKAGALAHARRWCAGERMKNGLLFLGGVGGGKSLLSALCVRERMVDGIALEDGRWPEWDWEGAWNPGIRWVNVARHMRQVRRRCFDQNDSTEADEVDALTATRILVLDDLAIGNATEWVTDFLLEVIDRRWVRRAETIGSANLSVEGLAEHVGERICSRLLGLCELVEVGGADMRRTRLNG